MVGLSMLINGNNKLNHGYTLLKQLSYDILSLLNDVVVSSESCSLINQNETISTHYKYYGHHQQYDSRNRQRILEL